MINNTPFTLPAPFIFHSCSSRLVSLLIPFPLDFFPSKVFSFPLLKHPFLLYYNHIVHSFSSKLFPSQLLQLSTYFHPNLLLLTTPFIPNSSTHNSFNPKRLCIPTFSISNSFYSNSFPSQLLFIANSSPHIFFPSQFLLITNPFPSIHISSQILLLKTYSPPNSFFSQLLLLTTPSSPNSFSSYFLQLITPPSQTFFDHNSTSSQLVLLLHAPSPQKNFLLNLPTVFISYFYDLPHYIYFSKKSKFPWNTFSPPPTFEKHSLDIFPFNLRYHAW